MNFNANSSNNMRSFVSESQIEERRQRRQEEWNKVRKADDPLEPPEEVYDPRPLYDRLKEQKMKKDEEYEESKKLKHLIKGLDNDEISFLEMVDNNKIEMETQRWQEEVTAIDEFKRAVAHLNREEQEKRLQEFKNDVFAVNSEKKKVSVAHESDAKSAKKSQSALLANVVKKRSLSECDEKSPKKLKEPNAESKIETISKCSDDNETESSKVMKSAVKCIGVLPGVGYYNSSDSSDSENSSNSEHEVDDMSGFKLIVRRKRANNREPKIETQIAE